MSRITKIIPEHAGYYWEWINNNKWILRWEPVSGYYSPPIFEHNINCMVQNVPSDLLDKIGYMIGKNGYFFKYITHWSGSVYIFYRNEIQAIEIWGTLPSIHKAQTLLMLHFQDVRNKK